MSNQFKRVKAWWDHKMARRAAKKYDLDFEHRCCFRGQIIDIGIGIKYGCGEIVKVPMRSRKTALYKLTSDGSGYGGTGQRNWKFEFQGYE